MNVNIKIEGVEQITAVFKQLPRSMQTKAYYRALFSGASAVKAGAEQNLKSMPMDEATGTLAKNIRVYRLKKRRGLYRVAVRVRKGATNKKKKDGSGAPVRVGLYGSVLEYGKKNQRPRSWIRKAIREERNRAVNRVIDGMRKHMIESLNDAKSKAKVPGRRFKVD